MKNEKRKNGFVPMLLLLVLVGMMGYAIFFQDNTVTVVIPTPEPPPVMIVTATPEPTPTVHLVTNDELAATIDAIHAIERATPFPRPLTLDDFNWCQANGCANEGCARYGVCE